MSTNHTIQFLESFIHEINKYLKELEINFKLENYSLSKTRKLVIENAIVIYNAHLQWAQKTLKSMIESNYNPNN